MVQKFKRLSSFLSLLRKMRIEVHKNPNTILHFTFKWNQVLNSFICPFVFQWKQNLETYIISRKFRKIYWLVPIFKLIHIIFLTRVATYRTSTTANKIPAVAMSIFCMNIAALIATTFADFVVLYFATDIIRSFSWSYKIANDFLSTLKYRKFS